MMKKIIILFSLLILSETSYCDSIFLNEPNIEDNDYLSTNCRFQKIHNSFQANEEPRNYDVISYDLELSWSDMLNSTKDNPEKRFWYGKNIMKISPLENGISEIEIDAKELDIISVFFWGAENLGTTYNTNLTGHLLIHFDTPINIGDNIFVEIKYQYVNPENKGFFHRNTIDSIESDIYIANAGTLSETIDARYWYPCNDRPNDKALFKVKISTPKNLEQPMLAGSNGNLDSIVNSDTSLDYYWSSKYPISPYLFTVFAGEYELKKDKIKKNSTTNDSLDIFYYYYPGDWDGELFSAKRMLEPTENTMVLFSDLFGDYAFEKYGVASVDFKLLGYSSLGMEHQTITCVSRSWYKKTNDSIRFSSFAHELGHHWFGDLVTCETWKDLWFNEGGASWLEALYLEEMFNHNRFEYYNHEYNFRRTYLSDIVKHPEVFNLSMYGLDDASGIFQNTSLIYSKASWIFHQIRELLGDSLTFSLFRELLNKHRFGNINSQQFVDFFVEKVPNVPFGIDLSKYISQWIFDAGHPKYTVSSISTLNNFGQYIVAVDINQVQSGENVPNTFEMLLELLFYNAAGEIVSTEKIRNNSTSYTLYYNFDEPISLVTLNDKKSLFEIIKLDSTINNIDYNKRSNKIFPNPILSNNDVVLIEIDEDTIYNVELFDDLGNKIIEGYNIGYSNNNIALINLGTISNGSYIVKINRKYYNKLMINRK